MCTAGRCAGAGSNQRAIAALVLSGCSQGMPASEAHSSTATPAAPSPTPSATEDVLETVPTKDLVIVDCTETLGAQVGAIDPMTGGFGCVAEFPGDPNIANAFSPTGNNGNVIPDFKRMATPEIDVTGTSSGMADHGWVNSDGTFADVTKPSEVAAQEEDGDFARGSRYDSGWFDGKGPVVGPDGTQVASLSRTPDNPDVGEIIIVPFDGSAAPRRLDVTPVTVSKAWTIADWISLAAQGNRPGLCRVVRDVVAS